MDIKIKLAITAASVLVASSVAYVITKRTLKADQALWAEPLPGTTVIEKLIITNEK